MFWKNVAKIGSYKISKSGREYVKIKGPSVEILMGIETMSDGRSVALYADQFKIVRGHCEVDVLYADVAAQGLRALGYEVV